MSPCNLLDAFDSVAIGGGPHNRPKRNLLEAFDAVADAVTDAVAVADDAPPTTAAPPPSDDKPPGGVKRRKNCLLLKVSKRR